MKKLYRKNNSQLAGICSGIADYLEIDSTVVRLLFVILFFTPLPIMWLYLFSWILIPKEPI